ncbi:3-keto-disaccharide hydrolase [Limisphaera sp. VF-2]|jgi:hypothetical protein|uniref:3-keto-disaccharide hydrolase n=1 Tax=Limisphaera sp. VF-2 TaxID=3400418 RepID=UPI00176CAF14
MRCFSTNLASVVCTLVVILFPPTSPGGEEHFEPLFPREGVPAGWTVRAWNDLSQVVTNVVWRVQDGVLHGGQPRGTWLVSEREYSDFILEFEFKLGERGNSGCALRAPMFGDPAFDGMELQMVDERYNPEAGPSELTGGIYRAVPPMRQVYRPMDWNRYRIELRGNRLKVVLNGEIIHDLNLDEQAQEVRRHDGSLAPPLKDRPRRGHIGFQELSREGPPVRIRNARICVLD